MEELGVEWTPHPQAKLEKERRPEHQKNGGKKTPMNLSSKLAAIVADLQSVQLYLTKREAQDIM